MALYLPEWALRRLFPNRFSGEHPPRPLPPVPPVPDAPVRLYIGPVNSAGQGFAWARAAELLDGVRAVSLKHVGDDVFRYPVDLAVPSAVFGGSTTWQRRHFRAASRFTHVLIESEASLFRPWFESDVEREVEALRRRGVRVGFVSHGSDLRVPSLHRAREKWSPFFDRDWEAVDQLEQSTRANIALLERLGAPVFVSGPAGRDYWPTATWLPVAIDPSRWQGYSPALQRRTLRVVHAPSRDRIKGSHLIEPVLNELAEAGVIEYRRVENVAADDMPGVYGAADVVLDSFRTGGYGVAASEALAAGRIVVSYVSADIREYVRSSRGVEIPIVQAEIDSLKEVLVRVASSRDAYRSLLDEGPAFVERLHDGRESARVLEPFLSS
jgi:hypothetical protein